MRTQSSSPAVQSRPRSGLAGCGSESKETSAPTATAGTSGAQVEIGNTINYGSFGTTADIDCADGKSLNVGGSNNTLTVKGTCAAVNIGGADNKITFEKIDKELSVVGLNNTVTYKRRRPQGRQPRLGQQRSRRADPARRSARRAGRRPSANRPAPSRDSAATREMLANSKSMASASDIPHWSSIDSRSDRMHCCGSAASSAASSSALVAPGRWARRDWPARSPALRRRRRRGR